MMHFTLRLSILTLSSEGHIVRQYCGRILLHCFKLQTCHRLVAVAAMVIVAAVLAVVAVVAVVVLVVVMV